jgi:hypothetical protein
MSLVEITKLEYDNLILNYACHFIESMCTAGTQFRRQLCNSHLAIFHYESSKIMQVSSNLW